ncbi:MAG: LysM peptidoglycan-binding domain-containing protein, partial [Chloroflexi bacterium]
MAGDSWPGERWGGQMMGRWIIISMVLAGLLIPVVGREAAAQTERASAVIAEVNAYRAALGLGSLATHPSLVAAAQMHVDWMVRTGNYGHTGEGGTSPADRAKAAGYPTAGYFVYENWVGGGAMTPFEAVAWWDQSPVHQATLRLQGFEHIGVGYAESERMHVYVLLIAKPSYPPSPSSAGGAGEQPNRESGGNDSAEETAPDDEPTEPAVVMVPVVKSEPGADGAVVHEVQQGQTVWTIAAVYDVKLMDLVVINSLGPDAIITPGQKLTVKLGAGQLPPTPPTHHTIHAGETAWTIAALYGLTLDQLLELNGIDRSTVLFPGDTVLIRHP